MIRKDDLSKAEERGILRRRGEMLPGIDAYHVVLNGRFVGSVIVSEEDDEDLGRCVVMSVSPYKKIALQLARDEAEAVYGKPAKIMASPFGSDVMYMLWPIGADA